MRLDIGRYRSVLSTALVHAHLLSVGILVVVAYILQGSVCCRSLQKNFPTAPRSAMIFETLAPTVYQEVAQTAAAVLTANTKATTAGQAAANHAAGGVYEAAVGVKDTAGKLRSFLTTRSAGEGSKICDSALCEALPFGSAVSPCRNLDAHCCLRSAALTHDKGSPENAPCIGPKPLVISDGWCPSGCSNEAGVGLSFSGSVSVDSTVWLPGESMVGGDSQGAVAYAAPTRAAINENFGSSSLSTKHPGETLSMPPATHACSSFPSFNASIKPPESREMKTNRRGVGERDANSGPSRKRRTADSTEECCGLAGLHAERPPGSVSSLAFTETAGTLRGISHMGEPQRWWDKPACPKGGWAAASTGLQRAANAREEISGIMSPGEHGEWVRGSGGDRLNYDLLSSLSLTGSPGYGRGDDYGSFDAGSARRVAPSQVIVAPTQSSFSPLPSSGTRGPSSGGSCAPSLYRGSSQVQASSPHQQSLSCLRPSPSPCLGDQRSKAHSSPMSVPHMFRGVSILTETLNKGTSDSPPTLSSVTSPERSEHNSAAMAVAAIEAAKVPAISDSNQSQDLRRHAAREGGGVQSPSTQFELPENTLPQEDQSQQRNSDDFAS